MTEPIRLRVHQALSDALKEITPANGYVHDLGASPRYPDGKVFRGRVTFGDKDPLPMVSILEVPIPIEQRTNPQGGTIISGPWELTVQGFVEDDYLNPTDPAHRLMAEVKMRIAVEMRKVNYGTAFGIREIRAIQLGPGVVRPPDDSSGKAYFWLSLIVDLTEDAAAPYA